MSVITKSIKPGFFGDIITKFNIIMSVIFSKHSFHVFMDDEEYDTLTDDMMSKDKETMSFSCTKSYYHSNSRVAHVVHRCASEQYNVSTLLPTIEKMKHGDWDIKIN